MASERSLTNGIQRPRLTADGRRSAIIEAARRVFAEHGFHGASTAEIAAAADCSEPTLYKHFASKHALFAAVLSDSGRCMGELVAEALDEADDPFLAFTQFMRSAFDRPMFAEIVRLRALALPLAHDPDIRAALVASGVKQREKAVHLLRLGQQAGTVRADIDADAVAWFYLGLALVAGFRHATEGAEGLHDMGRVYDAYLALLEPRKGVAS